MMQPARTNRVRPLLVFLNLLKCNSQGVAKLCLIHVEHHVAYTDSAADMLADVVRGIDPWHGTVAALYDITAQADRTRKGRISALEIHEGAITARTLLADMGRGMIRCVASIIGSPDHETETCSRHLRAHSDAGICSAATGRSGEHQAA